MVKILPHIYNPFAHIRNPLVDDGVVDDKEVLATKKKIMGSLRWSRLLTSISTVATIVGGPLVTAGVIGAANAYFVGTSATGFAAAIGGMPVVALLGIGALFVGAAVASTYIASRIWQSKQFDNLEINAKSTAHHLAQELKAANIAKPVEHEVPARADGKSWQQVVMERRQAQQQQGTQL